jgi:hypothetical protein
MKRGRYDGSAFFAIDDAEFNPFVIAQGKSGSFFVISECLYRESGFFKMM